MSKIMLATPIWLGEDCSEKAVLFRRIGVFPDAFLEQLHGKRCDRLKYFQVKCPEYENVEAASRKNDKLVQETLFFRGKT